MLGLVLGKALLTFLQQDPRLFDGFLAVLQLLAQVADLSVVVGQQTVEAGVVELRVLGAPVAQARVEAMLFGLQCLLAFLLGLEVGGQLDQGVVDLLQLLVGVGFALARLCHGVVQLLLPLFGAGMFTEQRVEFFLSGFLLGRQLGDLLEQGVELLLAMLLVGLFLVDRLLTFLLLGQFVALVAQLLQALADLLVQLHKGSGRLGAQTCQGVCGQQVGEGTQFLLKAFAVTRQFALLVDQ